MNKQQTEIIKRFKALGFDARAKGDLIEADPYDGFETHTIEEAEALLNLLESVKVVTNMPTIS